MKHSLRKKISRISFFVLFGTALTSCGGSNKSTTDVSPGEKDYEGFEDFPIDQYYGIQLGQDYKAAELVLFDQGFAKTEENESIHFWRNSDSTEVILPSNSTISNFRVFVNSKHFLNKKGDFMSFLEEKSTKTDKNGSFCVLVFSSEMSAFKMTVFDHSDYLRLQYEVD